MDGSWRGGRVDSAGVWSVVGAVECCRRCEIVRIAIITEQETGAFGC